MISSRHAPLTTHPRPAGDAEAWERIAKMAEGMLDECLALLAIALPEALIGVRMSITLQRGTALSETPGNPTLKEPRAWPCCLIIEDEPLVAMSLEDWLQEAGYEVCGPLGSTRETLAWLELNSPRAAILDISLKHGRGYEVARELKRRNILFLIYSGFPSESGSAPEVRDVPWIEKAQGRAALLDGIAKLLSPG